MEFSDSESVLCNEAPQEFRTEKGRSPGWDDQNIFPRNDSWGIAFSSITGSHTSVTFLERKSGKEGSADVLHAAQDFCWGCPMSPFSCTGLDWFVTQTVLKDVEWSYECGNGFSGFLDHHPNQALPTVRIQHVPLLWWPLGCGAKHIAECGRWVEELCFVWFFDQCQIGMQWMRPRFLPEHLEHLNAGRLGNCNAARSCCAMLCYPIVVRCVGSYLECVTLLWPPYHIRCPAAMTVLLHHSLWAVTACATYIFSHRYTGCIC